MAIAESFQDSASISTAEYFLAADSTTQGSGQSGDAAVQLFLDLANLVNGDEFRVRAWDAISSGGTARVIMEWTVAHAQSEPIWVTPTLLLMHRWDFSITRLAGADRTIAWSIRTVS